MCHSSRATFDSTRSQTINKKRIAQCVECAVASLWQELKKNAVVEPKRVSIQEIAGGGERDAISHVAWVNLECKFIVGALGCWQAALTPNNMDFSNPLSHKIPLSAAV